MISLILDARYWILDNKIGPSLSILYRIENPASNIEYKYKLSA